MILAWISTGEVVLALVIGLLLFGGRFPEVAKDIGRVFFRVRRTLTDLRRESGIDAALRDLERESHNIRQPLSQNWDAETPAVMETTETVADTPYSIGVDGNGEEQIENSVTPETAHSEPGKDNSEILKDREESPEKDREEGGS